MTATLSEGERKLLAMGRTLMAEPPFMLMDEPSMGFAPMLANEIFRIIHDINHLGKNEIIVKNRRRFLKRRLKNLENF